MSEKICEKEKIFTDIQEVCIQIKIYQFGEFGYDASTDLYYGKTYKHFDLFTPRESQSVLAETYLKNFVDAVRDGKIEDMTYLFTKILGEILSMKEWKLNGEGK